MFFQLSLFILADYFLIFDLFLSSASKGWKESIGFLDAELYAESFGKKIIKKNQIFQKLGDPENFRCGHKQPYNFFSVSADFRTFTNNSGKAKLLDSKQKKYLYLAKSFF